MFTVINQEIKRNSTREKCYYHYSSGPLTSEAKSIGNLTGQDYFYFYNAAAPLISKDLIMSKAYRTSGYIKGTADYPNCPMNKEELKNFGKN